jgi:phage minor structural protein
VYNDNGDKVRAVSVKESNYFNILQSIAETFETWLSLEIERDSVGGIIKKWVKFKNYAGNENHAYFRYGVNLKDINRTFASKNIVSKLIVKQNANKYGENEFCTI